MNEVSITIKFEVIEEYTSIAIQFINSFGRLSLGSIKRGDGRNRTAVEGFADLCIATVLRRLN